MKALRCIAIDDEPMALLVIEQFCLRKGNMDLTTFSEPRVGLSAILKEKPDLVFLDIQMNSISGLTIANALPRECCFIFTTAHAQYAMEGFDLDAVDFLHKPFSYERFEKAVDKVFRRMESKEAEDAAKTIVVKQEYNNVSIELKDITYVEALGNYIKIYRESGGYVLSRMNMKNMQALLPVHLFSRVHRSYIIAIRKVEKFTKNTILLRGVSKPVPVGKCYVAELSKLLGD